jgi:Zn-dependent peptidase ImmA (M78 family)
MTLSRVNEIEALAEFVADTYFPDERVDPLEIADRNSITHNFGQYEEAFDGLLEYRTGRFHIYANLDRLRSPEYPRARFTLGHELGHFYIDDHRNALIGGVGPHASFTDYQSQNPAEQEADAFAAAFLMPMERFRSAAGNRLPGAIAVRELAGLFGTSYASTAIRYARTNTHSVIVMRWTLQERKWCWSSEDLFSLTENKAYRAFNRIPADSLTLSTLRSVNGELERCESTLSKWFPYIIARSRKDRIVIEEVMPLGEFGVLTILYPE